jgi:hypothetical protein
MSQFQLSEINYDATYVPETLGITDERRMVLRKKVEHALVEYESQTEAANEYLKECKHFNEVYWCIYHAACFMENLRDVKS